MKKEIIQKSRALMIKSTRKNSSPTWELTEIAIKKGKELASRYNVDKNLVLASLYLAHTVFHISKKNPRRFKHEKLSARYIKKFLKQWKVNEQDQKVIINAIEAHHGKVKTKSKEAEVMKNAECFKFVTIKGSLIYLHTLGQRGYNYNEAVKTVLEKVEEKFKILTIPECKREAKKNRREILKIFKPI